MTKLDAMYWPNSVILETCVPSFTVNVPRVVVGAGEFSDGFRRGRSGADAKYGCSVICSRTSIARRKSGPQRLDRMCDKQSFVAGDECAIDRKLAVSAPATTAQSPAPPSHSRSFDPSG